MVLAVTNQSAADPVGPGQDGSQIKGNTQAELRQSFEENMKAQLIVRLNNFFQSLPGQTNGMGLINDNISQMLNQSMADGGDPGASALEPKNG